MKLDSKYFDSIRIERRDASQPAEEAASQGPCCQWHGCAAAGTHRAPQGRGRDGLYYFFCLDHVREYNSKYNYFNGMSDDEVQNFQKDAQTGHRPTWRTGANAWAHGTHDPSRKRRKSDAHPAAAAFFAWRQSKMHAAPAAAQRRLKPLERRALQQLGLGETLDRAEIKTRFKELVKLHHPDINGGDKGSEERLREIIQAYNHLKQAGLV